MNEFKIYRNGKYSTMDNLKFKARVKLPVILNKVDDFFVNH